jgi:hypothetical protein
MKFIILFICSVLTVTVLTAQNKPDSTLTPKVRLRSEILLSGEKNKSSRIWQLSGGINGAWDYYEFYSWKKYKLANRFCGSVQGNIQAAIYFGKKNRFGLGIGPHLGISQIAFNAVIPNTDFNNPADSVGNGFYRHGVKLPEETFTYRINYFVWGNNFYFNTKLNKKIEVSLFLGFLQYRYISKNFPEFNMAYLYSQHSGKSIRHTDMITYYDTNFWRACGGIETNLYLSKRVKLNIAGQTLLGRFCTYDSYIPFLLDGSGDGRGSRFMNKCFSFRIGLKYYLEIKAGKFYNL